MSDKFISAEEYAAANQSCLHEALVYGLTTSLQSFALSSIIFGGFYRYSAVYRKKFTTSAKTALFVMPIFYTGWLNIELRMKSCAERYRPSYDALMKRQREIDGAAES